MHTAESVGTRRKTESMKKTCRVCGLEVVVVNYAIETRRNGEVVEIGYLGRHWRPGIARTSNCRGSFGGWVK